MHGLWNYGGKMEALKAKVSARFRSYAKDFSLAVIAPHNMAKLPIDADSFTLAAAAFKRLSDEARRAGRQLVPVADPRESRDDGKLYVCLLPSSSQVEGFVPEERELLDIPHLNGRRAIVQGDISPYPLAEYLRRGSFGFDDVIVQDHHRWDEKFFISDSPLFADPRVLLINNHVIMDSPPDSYPSGAFTADLLATTGQPLVTEQSPKNS